MITGAGRGLGRALVERALSEGHDVLATTRGTGIGIEHERLTVLHLDVTDRAACRDAVHRAVLVGGRIDVLINNAGYGIVGAIEEVTEREARDILDADLLGPLWMTQAVLPVMRAQGHGHIAQISSVGGVGAMPFFGLYNAAKWGLEGFSEALAGEARTWGIGVTVAEIGAMDTDWATGSMRFSPPLREYDDIRSAWLGTADVPWPLEPGETGGGMDPAVAAQQLVAHIAGGSNGPLRLVIGDDAPEQIATVLAERTRDYANQPHQRPPAPQRGL